VVSTDVREQDVSEQQPDPDDRDPLGNNQDDPEGGDPNDETSPDSDRERTGQAQADENEETDPVA